MHCKKETGTEYKVTFIPKEQEKLLEEGHELLLLIQFNWCVVKQDIRTENDFVVTCN